MAATPEPFRAYRAVQATYDVRMARLLERTAKAIRARIAKLPVGVGGQVRKAQLTLVLDQIDKILRAVYGGPMLDTIQAGRKAGAVAAEAAAETLTSVAYAALPEAVAETLVRGLRASALSGIESAFARVPRELSTRVYRNSSLAIKQVHELIDQGLASGLSARELAASVYKHISPTTPGGASYAAMRLSRTEINNAFHERQIIAGERPGVLGCKWNLSGSHKVPDECNLFAQRDSHDLGRGVYPVGRVPDRPHPQCFCFLTYVTMTPKEFESALAQGQFDDELDRRTKANLARLGATPPAGAAEKPRSIPTNDNIRKSFRSGTVSEQELPGGAIAITTKVKFRDGSTGVKKVLHDDFDDIPAEDLADVPTAKDQQDAEELGALVARSMGLDAPEFLRLNEETTLQQFMPGRVAASLPAASAFSIAHLRKYGDTDDGILIGLMDQIIGNVDRNSGNWLTNAKRITPIDHGLAWNKGALKREGQPVTDFGSVFAGQFFKEGDRTAYDWKDVDVARADVLAMRDILETLRPEFKKRKQLKWLEWSLAQVDAILPHAVGKKRRIK